MKLSIATPVRRGDVMMWYAEATSNLRQSLLRDHGIDSEYITICNEAVVDKARNYLTWKFLQGDSTHLLFIDDDMVFSTDHAVRVVRSGMDLIGGAGAKKIINWERLERTCQHRNWREKKHCSSDVVCVPLENTMKVIENEPLRVKWVGAAFMLISRKLVEDVAKIVPHVKTMLPNQAGMTEIPWWFEQENKHGEQGRTEDYVFCERAIQAGYKVYLAPWMGLKHIGFHMYEGCIYCSNGSFIHKVGPG